MSLPPYYHMPYQAIIQTPIGKLGLNINHVGVTRVNFLSESMALFLPRDPFIKNIVADLDAYFADPKHIFSQTLDLSVTPFQNKILTRLQKIPAGQVCSYGEIAKEMNTGARALGNVCRKNPVPIFIPCHRIVAAGGIGGYWGARSGKGVEIKRWLLEHEGAA